MTTVRRTRSVGWCQCRPSIGLSPCDSSDADEWPRFSVRAFSHLGEIDVAQHKTTKRREFKVLYFGSGADRARWISDEDADGIGQNLFLNVEVKRSAFVGIRLFLSLRRR